MGVLVQNVGCFLLLKKIVFPRVKVARRFGELNVKLSKTAVADPIPAAFPHSLYLCWNCPVEQALLNLACKTMRILIADEINDGLASSTSIRHQESHTLCEYHVDFPDKQLQRYAE